MVAAFDSFVAFKFEDGEAISMLPQKWRAWHKIGGACTSPLRPTLKPPPSTLST